MDCYIQKSYWDWDTFLGRGVTRCGGVCQPHGYCYHSKGWVTVAVSSCLPVATVGTKPSRGFGFVLWIGGTCLGTRTMILFTAFNRNLIKGGILSGVTRKSEEWGESAGSQEEQKLSLNQQSMPVLLRDHKIPQPFPMFVWGNIGYKCVNDLTTHSEGRITCVGFWIIVWELIVSVLERHGTHYTVSLKWLVNVFIRE